MQTAEKMMWVFGAGFVLFGLIFSQTEKISPYSNIWGGMSVFSLGLFSLSMVVGALQKREIKAERTTIRLDEHPLVFKLYVGLIAFAGAVVLCAGFWVVFFRN